MEDEHRYFILNKPTEMVSQFISPNNVKLLGDLPYAFPVGTHAIGRLDSNSEGLLLLTTDKRITSLLFQGGKPHARTYLVMVNKVVTDEKLDMLRNGIPIKISNGNFHKAAPEKIERIIDPFLYYPYATDLRMSYPHSWLLITLTEGKYHQVRKMVFQAGHRCLRLVRTSIEDLSLGNLPPGELKELSKEEFYTSLKLV